MAFVPPSVLANEDRPGSDPLTIGQYTFLTSQAPEEFSIGGVDQKIAQHFLIGGGIVTQSMGVEPRPITWEAWAFAPNADALIQQMRAYAVAGLELPISWRTESYFCKIKSFQPKYYNRNWAKCEITVVITRDNNGAFTVTQPPGVDDQVNSLLLDANKQNNVIAAADPTGAQSYQSSLTNMQVALQSNGSIAQLSGNALTTVQNAVTAAQAATQAYASAQSGTSANFVPANRLASIITLISGNVARGQKPNQVQQVGGSLYRVASMQYQDITQAFNVMTSNGLSSPQIPKAEYVTLTLPPFSSGSNTTVAA